MMLEKISTNILNKMATISFQAQISSIICIETKGIEVISSETFVSPPAAVSCLQTISRNHKYFPLGLPNEIN